MNNISCCIAELSLSFEIGLALWIFWLSENNFSHEKIVFFNMICSSNLLHLEYVVKYLKKNIGYAGIPILLERFYLDF